MQLKIGYLFQCPPWVLMKYKPTPCKGKSFINIRILIYRLMVYVNQTIVIKSSSPKLAEWVKKTEGS